MVKNGAIPELLLAGKYGNALHVWDLRTRAHLQKLELGADQQMALELRPAHDPRRSYGFVGVVVSTKDLSSSIHMWMRNEATGQWETRKVITIPAQPADPANLPPFLKGFGAVPPFVTDINLSLDDKFLYVSCWGTGELRQYDVSDPLDPKLTGTLEIGGIVKRAPHPKTGAQPLNGGPQMVEVSRDGRRVYLTNALYSPWDAQFYPDGIRGWMARVDVAPTGGIAFDPEFLVEFEEGLRPHQVRLQGGDASSDSFCYAE
jgi:selenium-binding protein 1